MPANVYLSRMAQTCSPDDGIETFSELRFHVRLQDVSREHEWRFSLPCFFQIYDFRLARSRPEPTPAEESRKKEDKALSRMKIV